MDEKSSLIETSRVIYEQERRKSLEGSKRVVWLFGLSIFLSLSAIVSISLLQYDEYFAFLNDRSEYIKASRHFCESIVIYNVDTVSTPIACLLILIYILIYKRRCLLVNKFKYRNVGIPMIVSIWNKRDRLYTAFTYGTIAFNVYIVVRDSMKQSGHATVPVKDPTGFILLLVKILEILGIGVRYYPVLVAYRANSLLIALLTAIYMWIDFGINIYQYGKCESISSETSMGKQETKRRLWYFIIFKILSSIPLCVFTSFIVIHLSYKSAILLFDYIFRKRYFKSEFERKASDTFFCTLLNVDDDHEILYSKSDLDYVYDLLNNDPKMIKSREYRSQMRDKSKEERIRLRRQSSIVKCELIYSELLKKEKPSSALKHFFHHFIYEWNRNFRFSSKFINALTVALVALYYFFLNLTYAQTTGITYYMSKLPTWFYTGNLTVNIGELICSINEAICIEGLKHLPEVDIALPKTLSTFLPFFRSSVNAIIIVPLFVSLFICVVQLFLLVRESKQHMIEMYKGRCEYVVKASNYHKYHIIASAIHFSGYMVGYLIWGYLTIYLFIVIIGIVILIMRMFIGDQVFLEILLKLIPAVTAFLVHHALVLLASKLAFDRLNTKLMALNNFRLLNIFAYFNFYYDCFIGFFSSMIRLLSAIIAAILYMPRISYSFFGRHLEKFDKGYFCYSSFLHLESMHTNPIIISFISMLYYKELQEFIRRHHIEKRLFAKYFPEHRIILGNFQGHLPPATRRFGPPSRQYSERVLNQWYMLIMLEKNKILIPYRKHNMGFLDIYKVGVIDKTIMNLMRKGRRGKKKEKQLKPTVEPVHESKNDDAAHNDERRRGERPVKLVSFEMRDDNDETELPTPKKISFKANNSNGNNEHKMDLHHNNKAKTVTHLPPITLTFEYKKSPTTTTITNNNNSSQQK